MSAEPRPVVPERVRAHDGARRVTRSWLALRGPADAAARDGSGGGLAAGLERHLRMVRPGRPWRLVDLGAGTGAGATWLRARLTGEQRWRLLDRDAALLRVAGPVTAGWAAPVVADLHELGRLLDDEPAEAVTCQALLDLLTPGEVDAVLGPTVRLGSALLASLTVTGEVVMTPAHPSDKLVAELFNAHQHRDGRLGPDAVRYLTRELARRGYRVRTAATPWVLASAAGAQRHGHGLIDEWLSGRAGPAVEQSPADRAQVSAWLAARRRQAAAGGLTAVVRHLDLLALPPPPRGVTPSARDVTPSARDVTPSARGVTTRDEPG